ncbi:right-handed parallel beta-helix repeat-containing protein [Persicitalea sp.]|uniref:right-handed parallel beta-helix repeat-containing protein n=1 Tax=Persicitalea sp. TaxID=3100273 RepID=UPI0035941CBD
MFVLPGNAQNVGINSSGAAPHPSAAFDIVSTTKGLLIPRVALVSLNSSVPVTSPAPSLLVYNTATSGSSPNQVTPGYYYWEAGGWKRLSDSPGAAAISLAQFRSGAAKSINAFVLTDSDRAGLFVFSSTSSMPDDSALVLIDQGRRFLRLYEGGVQPEWFGAAGNNSSDDTNAFRKALRHLHVQADGIYRLTDDLVLPKGGALTGQGTLNFDFTSLKNGLVMADDSKLDGLTINMLSTVSGGADQNNTCIQLGKKIRSEFVSNVSVKNVTLSSNKPAGCRVSVNGGSNHIVMDRVRILGKGGTGTGICIEWGMIDDTPQEGIVQPNNIDITNVIISGLAGSTTDPGNAGFFLSGVHDVRLSNIYTDSTAFAAIRIFPGDYGSYYSSPEEKLKANTGIVLDNISSYNCKRHALSITGVAPLAPGSPRYSIPLLCTNSLFSNIGGGTVAGISFDNVRDCRIENSIITGFYINSYCQDGAYNINFRNVTHRNSIWHGAYLEGGTPPEDIRYTECYFENCGTGTAGGAGIFVANARRPYIQNCLFGNIGTEDMRYGVLINSQNNPVAASLSDNYVRNLRTGGIGYSLGNPSDTGLVYKMFGNRVKPGLTFRNGSTNITIDQN